MTKALKRTIRKRYTTKSDVMTVFMNIRKKKQIDFCVKLLHKTKQDYFNNIDIKKCQWY